MLCDDFDKYIIRDKILVYFFKIANKRALTGMHFN